MNNQIHICSVCNCEYNDGDDFCSLCGFDLITIPNNSSEWLKNYYQKKTDWHKKNIEIHNSNIEQLGVYKNEIDRIKEENLLLKNFQSGYGEKSIISWLAPSNKANTIIIEWEMISQLKFRFSSNLHVIEKILPNQIILLLKKDGVPNKSDFNIALMIDTTNFEKVDIDTSEVLIKSNEIKNGEYFVRFINIDYNVEHIIYVHKEQKNHPTFDRNKIKIYLT